MVMTLLLYNLIAAPFIWTFSETPDRSGTEKKIFREYLWEEMLLLGFSV